MSVEKWERVLRSSVTGAFLLCRESVKSMYRRGGCLVVIGSGDGMAGVPGRLNHSAGQAAVVTLAKGLAREVAQRGIRVNVVATGLNDPDVLRTPSAPEAATNDHLTRDAPLDRPTGTGRPDSTDRPGGPEEAAAVVAFLASPAAGCLTGQVLPVDGASVP